MFDSQAKFLKPQISHQILRHEANYEFLKLDF